MTDDQERLERRLELLEEQVRKIILTIRSLYDILALRPAPKKEEKQ